MTVAIIDTGCANILSVQCALDRLGAVYRLAASPDEAVGAHRLILPGVGTASAAMRTLRARGWVKALKAEKRPLLGICLGMQLLYEQSDEDGTACLGLIPGRVSRLAPPEGAPWPHMGWNRLDFIRGADRLLEGVDPGSHVYFVHGFAAPDGPATVATCEYGQSIPAVVRKEAVTGCQFHPERSSATGQRILANFIGSP